MYLKCEVSRLYFKFRQDKMAAVNAISKIFIFQLLLYETEIRNLKLELERGEIVRQGLERDIILAKREADLQLYTAEDELSNVKVKLLELQGKKKKKKKEATSVPSHLNRD